MKAPTISVPAIPTFLSHLSVVAGLPVPYTAAVINGKPDFRVIDPGKVVSCIKNKLCGICGKKLGEWSYLIGGPASKENRLFKDPAMHKPCAEFAASVCPFLTGKREGYSDRPLSGLVERSNAMAPERPPQMFMCRVTTKDIKPVSLAGELVISVRAIVEARVF